MSEGWIKIHRKMLNWEWYKKPKTCRLFFHLLLKANRTTTTVHGIEIKAGEILTSRKKLSEETGLSEQEIRTCLSDLQATSKSTSKSTSTITIKSTNKYTLITVVKWELFQENKKNQPTDQPANQPANPQQINHKQEDIEEEDREKKKILKEKKAFDIFVDFAKENNLSIPAKLTNTRKSKLRARLKDCGGLEGWETALEKLKNSSFCMGKVNSFKANLDFLLQEKSFTKLMEGAYDDNRNRGNTTKKPTESMFNGFSKAIVENSEVW